MWRGITSVILGAGIHLTTYTADRTKGFFQARRMLSTSLHTRLSNMLQEATNPAIMSSLGVRVFAFDRYAMAIDRYSG